MSNKRVLLTGSGGFIGSHCVEYFLDSTEWDLICLDSFRHKGTHRRTIDVVGEKKLNEATKSGRLVTLRHDLCVPIDAQLENLIMGRSIDDRGKMVEKKLDFIINMASESAVERSITDPVPCLRNNYELAINMLEFARRVKPKIFFQISTDETFGEAEPNQAHHEWDVIMPSNPYAASKAAQEALAISYWRSYNVPVVITNTMNNYAQGQDPEKFIPKIIKMVALDQEVPVYAEKTSPDSLWNHQEGGDYWNIGTRFYLHAKNHADVFVFLSQFEPALYSKGAKRPDKYNVCGDVELNNLEIAQLIAKIMGKNLKYKLVSSESIRSGYDRRYALDGSLMKKLGWKMPLTFEQSLEGVVRWTLDHPHWIT
jgi:dTDP-glucose 4,6-dehydratase